MYGNLNPDGQNNEKKKKTVGYKMDEPEEIKSFDSDDEINDKDFVFDLFMPFDTSSVHFEDELTGSDDNTSDKIDADYVFDLFIPAEEKVDNETNEMENVSCGEVTISAETRQKMMDEYTELAQEKTKLKMKNKFLSKRILEYWKKHTTNDLSGVKDTVQHKERYQEMLIKYNELTEGQAIEENAINDYVLLIDEKLKNMKATLESTFNKFINMQIDSKPLSIIEEKKLYVDKLISNLIEQQRNKLKKVSNYQLTYIRVNNKVKHLQEEIDKFQYISANVNLFQCEQLFQENMEHIDKIEEKENDLRQYRSKYTFALVNIAHLREKIDYYEENIKMIIKKSKVIDKYIQQIRVHLSSLQSTYNGYRKEIELIKYESHLLTRDNLLEDFKNCIKEADDKKKILNNLKDTCLRDKCIIEELKHKKKKSNKK